MRCRSHPLQIDAAASGHFARGNELDKPSSTLASAMTLILSFVDPQYAIQVSDRRVTEYPSGRVVNDTTSKTTLFGGRVLFGFTGLGRLDGEPTHQWMTKKLSEALTVPVEGSERFPWFAEQLDAALGQVHLPRQLERVVKRIAVVGVGYVRAEPDPRVPPLPRYVVISNFHGDSGEWLPEARPTCRVEAETVRPPIPYRCYAAGANLTREERRRLDRLLNRCVARRTGAEPIARLLAEQVRAVAVRTPTVGKSLLVSSLPAAEIPAGMMMRISRPDFSEPTFLYLPDEASYDAFLYGPNVATRGSAITDISAAFGEAAEKYKLRGPTSRAPIRGDLRMKTLVSVFSVFVLSFIVYVTWKAPSGNLLELATFVVLAVTLVVLLWYAHDTHVIARATHERWQREGVLGAGYEIQITGSQGDAGRTLLRLHNPSRLVVRARMNCNFRVYGERVTSGPLYDGSERWLVFPQQISQGWVEIESLLQMKGKSVAQAIAERTSANYKEQLTMLFELEFTDELDGVRRLPPRHHYFDFVRWAWIPSLGETGSNPGGHHLP